MVRKALNYATNSSKSPSSTQSDSNFPEQQFDSRQSESTFISSTIEEIQQQVNQGRNSEGPNRGIKANSSALQRANPEWHSKAGPRNPPSSCIFCNGTH
ncbi:hypothetical protein niasHT_032824 [Heterodera trifolii]|uniref:Uncharacterized protein n=1 Tax=Heterodera trifolii TaxID=157864 RepID=A0ABD2IT27_9BILA